MSVETELKFLATAEAIHSLPEQLHRWSVEPLATQQLNNIYYDTSDYFFRNQRMGLRVRKQNDHYEMTLKCKAQNIAGIQQRPEYNIPLTTEKPDLTLLPKEIWSDEEQLNQLSTHLQPLFFNDFNRQRWLITLNESRIELAVDVGHIGYDDQQDIIREIELELLSGNLSDLLSVAEQLLVVGGLRLSHGSKAARGYELIQKTTHLLKPISVLSVAKGTSVESAMIATLNYAINHWQYHEQLWLEGNQQAKSALQTIIAYIRQIWITVGGIIPRKATSLLRHQLEPIEQNLNSDLPAEELISQYDYQFVLLSLIRWLAEQQWQAFCDESQKKKLNSSFKRFADIMLGRNRAELKRLFTPTQTAINYSDQAVKLQHKLLEMHFLAAVYPKEESQPWLTVWRKLLDALDHPSEEYKNKLRKQALAAKPFWLTQQN